MVPHDDDWLGTHDTIPAPDSEPRPQAASIWRCDDIGAEPVRCATLIEATDRKPESPDAQVYGRGKLLATSHDGVAMWAYTDAGRDVIAQEAHGALARDYDTVLAIVLADDMRSAS